MLFTATILFTATMLFTSTPKCVKSQNQLPFYSKMWNTSFYHEGCGWTGDIWIIPDKSESGTFNTFRCFRKLPQSSVCKWQWKWKDVYFSVSRRIFQKSQKNVRWSCAEPDLPPLPVSSSCRLDLTLLFYLCRWPPWCTGVCWTWSKVILYNHTVS